MQLSTAETAYNLWSLADEFRSSGQLLMQSTRSSGLNVGIYPPYYMLCHGLELALKAFLRAHGFNASKLKTLGHSLSECLKEAHKSGLPLKVKLTKNELDNVRLIDQLYHAKELEYIISGGIKHLPAIAKIYNVLGKVLAGIHSECLESTIRERETP